MFSHLIGLVRSMIIARYACLFLVLGVAGCSQNTSSRPMTAPNMQAMTARVALEPGDILNVDVFNEKELSGRFQVSDTGTIDYPLIGRIKATGATPPEVGDEIRRRLAGGYLKNPQVNVYVRGYNKKNKVMVWGQVQRSGTFNYVANMTVVEAVTLAGGLTPLADKNVTVTRVESGKNQNYTVQLGDTRAANYRLRAGDVIFVPERIF